MTTLFKQFPIAEKRWADNKDSNKYTIESKAIINWKLNIPQFKHHSVR